MDGQPHGPRQMGHGCVTSHDRVTGGENGHCINEPVTARIQRGAKAGERKIGPHRAVAFLNGNKVGHFGDRGEFGESDRTLPIAFEIRVSLAGER